MKKEDLNFCPRCGTPFSQHNQLPVTCGRPECAFQIWLNPTPVVAVLCELEEGLVMAHNKSWPPGVLAPITGFIEYGEAPDIAARREAKEELGLDIEQPALLGVYNFPAMNQTIIAYHARVSGPITLGDELDEYKVIPLSKLKAWNYGTGLAVADLLRKSASA